MTNAQNPNKDFVILNLRDNPIISNPKPPQVLELRSLQRATKAAGVIHDSKAGFQVFPQTALGLTIKFAHRFLHAFGVFNFPDHATSRPR